MSISPLWFPASFCGINVTITTQADIANLRIASPGCHNNITVINAEPTLTFDNITVVNGVYVRDSPNLKVLSFPDLIRLSALAIHDAPTLLNISLPSIVSVGVLPFGENGWQVPQVSAAPAADLSLIVANIHNAPALKTIDFQFFSGLFGLELVGADSLASYYPKSSGYPLITTMINSSQTLSLDGCFDLGDLKFAQFVRLVGRTGCYYNLRNWRSAFNLTLVNTALSYLDISHPFLVNGTLEANSLHVPDNTPPASPALSFISSIGYNANLTSNSNVDLSLDEVETLPGSLFVRNNTNCTLSFSKLSDVTGNISMIDNSDSMLPWFPNLRRAADIHLRGNIITPNIFPALTSIPGTVIIEAWNSDFNCSKLVSQHLDGIIPNLSCNGTNNETEASSGAPALSQGAKAGIGVGAAVGLLGAATAIIWLVLWYKIRLKEASQRNLTPLPGENKNAANIQQPGAQWAIHEKPDDQVHQIEGRAQIQQMEGRMIIQENPGAERYELHSEAAREPVASEQRASQLS
ncbi:hypothetical protein F5Y14DRAFT_415319 [Nemania sp. NC0429]|nr:hypothetical protein F5Y14DRAFT_415319 [Nemania sp. NC0429]